MIITFVKDKLLLNWFINISKDLERVYQFKLHGSIHSFKNELDLKTNNTIAIVDVEDVNYQIYTSNHFKQSDHIKFIGIGYKKNIKEAQIIYQSNVKGFVCNNCSSFDLLKAIENLQNGGIYFPDYIKDDIVNQYLLSNPDLIQNFNRNISINKYPLIEDKLNLMVLDNKIEKLTDKERKVCHLLSQGLSYKEIANLLEVSTFAINQNAKSIYKKTKVRSRAELSYIMFK